MLKEIVDCVQIAVPVAHPAHCSCCLHCLDRYKFSLSLL